MSKTPIIDKKELKEPDAFVKVGRSLVLKFRTHQKTIGRVTIAALIVSAGVYGYEWWSNQQLEKAWAGLYEIQKKPESERDALIESYAAAGNLRPHLMATLSVADKAFTSAKNKSLKKEDAAVDAGKAFEYYSKALKFSKLQPFEVQLIMVDQAKSLELEKKMGAAIEVLEAASGLGADGKPLIELNRARLLSATGEKEKAVQLYEAVASEFPDTEFARLAKAHRRILKMVASGNAN